MDRYSDDRKSDYRDRRDRDRDRGGEREDERRTFRKFQRPRPPRELAFDYKDVDGLKRFMTEHGRIVPRRISRLNARQQTRLTTAIKRARVLGLLPFDGIVEGIY